MTRLDVDSDSGRSRSEPASSTPGVLVQELDRIAEETGRARKILIGRTHGEGKELLRQVALRGRSWTGFEVETLRPLASRIAAPRLARDGLAVMDSFDEHALLERALDRVIPRFPDFSELAEKTGFREAVRHSVAALRNAGVRPDVVEPRGGDSQGFDKTSLVTQVLAAYESLMREANRTDTAGILRRATRSLDGGERPRWLADARIFLLPGLPDRGLERGFLEALQGLGAEVLRTDAVEGLNVPDGVLWEAAPPESWGSWLHAVDRCEAAPPADRIELFRAASVYDELRGVLRRALDMGARWDQVEIVAADPWSYGSALHAVAEAKEIPVNFAVGLPVERTRPGRVVSTWFRWIESGFQESLFRALVEAGDVTPPGKTRSRGLYGPSLARALRRLRIGWGRERTLEKIEQGLEDISSLRPKPTESEAKFEERRKWERRKLMALRDLLRPVLEATPATDGQASPSEVASGVKSLLKRATSGTATDGMARQRLLGQLDRIEATLTRPTDFASACAIVQARLQIRIPAPGTKGLARWSTAPGAIYLTDLRHGGATGRRFTFIVGLHARSVVGSLHEDPLLGDEERRRIGEGELPLASDRADEARFDFAQLFARLRGTVVVSYPCWDPVQSRKLAPASEMLQAHRLRKGRSTLGFEDLDDALGDAESRAPRQEITADLDRSDAWLRALTRKPGRFRDGLAAVSRSFPRLGGGLAVARALERDEPSVHTGFLGAHSPSLSYQDVSDLKFSASGLETLGTCPRRFLFKYIIKAYPPDDPEFDPGRWLNALKKGGLLHRVFEKTLKKARCRGIEPLDSQFEILAQKVLALEGQKELRNTPSPSQAVHRWQMEELQEDVRSFVGMIRKREPQWLKLEWPFGGDTNLKIHAGCRSVLVRGSVDRVDDRCGHPLVVDYKTGSDYKYRSTTKTFDGGRRLQHFLYASVVADEMGSVDAMEYHFPTVKGENRIRRYDASQLQSGGTLVKKLLDSVERGCFPATDNLDERKKRGKDCRYCDYKEICGAQADARGEVTCSVAEWTERNRETLAELAPLREVRGWDTGQSTS